MHSCTNVLYWQQGMGGDCQNWQSNLLHCHCLNHQTSKKRETTCCGATWKARRVIVEDKFYHIVSHFGAKTDKEFMSWGSAYTQYQYAMISWVDDAEKFCKPDLFTFIHNAPNIGYAPSFVGKKMSWWSKMIPCNFFLVPKTQTCASYLQWDLGWKLILTSDQKAVNFTLASRGTTSSIPSSPATLMLSGLLLSPRGFTQGIGVNSFIPTKTQNFCAKSPIKCMLQRWRDSCSCWKSNTCQQDTYARCQSEYPLCQCKGCGKIMQEQNHHIPTYWWFWHHPQLDIAAYCVNHVQFLEREFCIVFGHALAWCIFYNEQHGGFVHWQNVERVIKMYCKLGDYNSLGELENLISKFYCESRVLMPNYWWTSPWHGMERRGFQPILMLGLKMGCMVKK